MKTNIAYNDIDNNRLYPLESRSAERAMDSPVSARAGAGFDSTEHLQPCILDALTGRVECRPRKVDTERRYKRRSITRLPATSIPFCWRMTCDSIVCQTNP
jgi:hypothetical protein